MMDLGLSQGKKGYNDESIKWRENEDDNEILNNEMKKIEIERESVELEYKQEIL